MNGLYLYCIREKQLSSFSADGLYASCQAFALPFNDLEAIVSNVPMDQLGQEQIKLKAQEDLEWIKEMAQRHESVVEQAMRIDGEIHPVIPMRFGTVFRNPESVQQSLENEYPHYSECLTQLKQKQEWSVKLYLVDPAPLRSEVSENDSLIIQKKKEIAAMPRGMAYFFQSELNNLILQSINEKLDCYTESVFTSLKQHADLSLQGKILEKEFTGRPVQMILNAIFLIYEKNISAFKQEVTQFHASLKSRGLQLEYSGPWPPYHFVKDSSCARKTRKNR